MIAMPMSTRTYWWIPTMRIRNAWKIGLNSQASRLTGSALSVAGVTISGVGLGAAVAGAAVARGAAPARGRGLAPRRPARPTGLIGAQAPITRATTPTRRPEQQRETARRRARAGRSSDGVEAAGMAGVAAGDPPGAHPGPAEEAVASRSPARCSASSVGS